MYPTIKIDATVQTISSLQNVQTKEVIHSDTNQRYLILNTDTNYVCNDDTKYRHYNSVVLDPATRSILCIGPPISYDWTTFKTLYPEEEVKNDHIHIEEMIEGLSVYLFYDFRIKQWEIATKNSVAGNYSYYRLPGVPTKTFRQMLFETLNLNIQTQTLNDWVGIQFLNTKHCYHFILQHPDNHMVLNQILPKLYFCGMYQLHIDGVMNDVVYYSAHWKQVFPNDFIYLPNKWSWDGNSFSYDGILSKYNASHTDESLHMGFSLLHNHTGYRTFVINQRYKDLQTLRGTHPNMLYQYICLRKVAKVREFLLHFPQYKQLFWSFYELYEKLIEQMHKSYFDYYIKKAERQIQKKLFFHIAQIHHTVYKPSLQEETKIVVRKKVVREYLDKLEPGCILHLLQHDKYTQEGVVRE